MREHIFIYAGPAPHTFADFVLLIGLGKRDAVLPGEYRHKLNIEVSFNLPRLWRVGRAFASGVDAAAWTGRSVEWEWQRPITLLAWRND